jgi:hypothetical protein
VSDIKRILDAMAQLAEAIPGGRRSMSMSMHGCDDAALRALIGAGGKRENYQNDAGTEEWDAAVLHVGSVVIVAYSQHRPLGSASVDRDAVESALAQAREALS